MRKMWAASPFQQRQPGTVDCWNVRRDSTRAHLDASRYFADALSGAHCPSNWYNGNPGTLGMQVPTFSGDAPALLGFDETIDTYCAAQPATNTAPDGGNWHAHQCIAANLNILSLYGERVPYNLCRNLEWQVCAALGKLPGQSETYVVFSKAPSELHPGVTSSKPFGQCRGWRDTRGGCEGGYATDDIFFLEVCVFNQICSNGAELWQLDAGVLWRCHMNATRFRVLQAMLTAEPDWSEPRGLLPRCESWCNAWTCAHRSCAGCGAEVHASRQLGCP